MPQTKFINTKISYSRFKSLHRHISNGEQKNFFLNFSNNLESCIRIHSLNFNPPTTVFKMSSIMECSNDFKTSPNVSLPHPALLFTMILQLLLPSSCRISTQNSLAHHIESIIFLMDRGVLKAFEKCLQENYLIWSKFLPRTL